MVVGKRTQVADFFEPAAPPLLRCASPNPLFTILLFYSYTTRAFRHSERQSVGYGVGVSERQENQRIPTNGRKTERKMQKKKNLE